MYTHTEQHFERHSARGTVGCLLQGNSFLIGYQLLPHRPICFGKDEENEGGVRENEEGKGREGAAEVRGQKMGVG